jgi:RHS repeat-associated protein
MKKMNRRIWLLATDKHNSVMLTCKGTSYLSSSYLPFGYRDGDSEGLMGFNGEALEKANRYYLLGNGYRVFNTVIMRFASPDLLSPFSGGGINCYSYCKSEPVNRVDPTGRMPSLGGMLGGRNLMAIAAVLTLASSAGLMTAYLAKNDSQGLVRKALLYSAIGLGVMGGALAGGYAKSRFLNTHRYSPLNPILLGYHGTPKGSKISNRGFFKKGELFLTDRVESAAHYAGDKGRVFGVYADESALASLSARYAPKLNAASNIPEMPLNIHRNNLIQARAISNPVDVDLDQVFGSFGRTHEQYHASLVAKLSKKIRLG